MSTSPVSINSFLSEIVSKRGGPSTPVLYNFDISPRSITFKDYLRDGLKFDMDSELRFLNYLNNEIQIPGVTFQNSEVRMPQKGIAIKSASSKVFNEMDLSFISDAQASPYRFFRGWVDFIGGVHMYAGGYNPADLTPRKTSVLRYYNQYTCDMKISKMEKYKTGGGYKTPYEIRLTNAWPYTISSIPLSQASQNGLVKVSVSLYYEYSQVQLLDPTK